MTKAKRASLIVALLAVVVGACWRDHGPQRWDVGRIGLPREWVAKKCVLSPSETRQSRMLHETLRAPASPELTVSADVKSAGNAAIRRVLTRARFNDRAASFISYHRMEPVGTRVCYAAYRLRDDLIAVKGKLRGHQVVGLRVFYARVDHPEAADGFLKHVLPDVASQKVEVELYVGPNEERKHIHGVIVTWGDPVTRADERRSRVGRGASVASIDRAALFSELNLMPRKVGLTCDGWWFMLEPKEGLLAPSLLVVAVTPAAKSARKMLAAFVARVPVSPLDVQRHIGDECVGWGAENRNHASVAFTRANVFVRFLWPGKLSSAVDYAERLDDLLKKGAGAMTRGAAPRSSIANVPPHVWAAAGSIVGLSPKARGLDPKRMQVAVDAPGHLDARGDENNNVVLKAPPKGQTARVSVIAGDVDRLLVVRRDVVVTGD